MQTMPNPSEVAQRGNAIYDAQIKQSVEKTHFGEFLMLDVDSGDYEIDGDDIAAEDRLRARHPDAVIYQLRIGDTAAYFLGGGWG